MELLSSEKCATDLPLLANVELLPQILLQFKLLAVVNNSFLLGLPIADMAAKEGKTR